MNFTFHVYMYGFLSRKKLNPGPSEVNTVKPGTDVAFKCLAIPNTGRSSLMRSCKNAIVHYDDYSSSSDDDNDIYNYPDDAVTNFEETEQQNLIESTKNSPQNEVSDRTEEENVEADTATIPEDYYKYDDDSDPYGYTAEMLGQNNPSDDDY